MAEEKTPFTRTCAWTGEEFEGKGIVVTTTDGTEVVSEEAFMAPWRGTASAPQDQAPAEAETEPADPEPAA